MSTLKDYIPPRDVFIGESGLVFSAFIFPHKKKPALCLFRANVEFSQSNGRNERKRGSVNKNTQPPRSGTAVFVGGFPLGACFCNYGMHKLDIRPIYLIEEFRHVDG